MGDEREHNVGNSQEGVHKGRVGSDIVLDVIWGLDTNRDHSDDGRNQDTGSGDSRHDEHLASGAWEGTYAADDQPDHAEDDGAGAVVGDGVEEHREGENVAGHEEDDEEQLTPVADFTADWAHEHLSCVAHAVHVGVAQLELAHNETGVPGDGRETEDNEEGSGSLSGDSYYAARHWDIIRDNAESGHGRWE